LRRIPISDEAVRALRTVRRLAEGPIYLVGGALRDACLGRPFFDMDLAAEKPLILARRLARAIGRRLVVLDENERVYRIILREGGTLKQIDVAGFKGSTIGEDLRRRDFTVNALAWPVPRSPGRTIPKDEVLDPRGGFRDLKARRLCCESAALFKEDPLRILRAFRLAAELDFKVDPGTISRIRASSRLAAAPAGERIRSELIALLACQGSSWLLRLMDETRVLTSIFKELAPQRRCAQAYYGRGGVLKHSLDVVSRLEFLLDHLERAFPGQAKALQERVSGREGEPSPGRALLMLAALLHDVAKPRTARKIEGRLRFFGHDTLGAKMAMAIMKRLRFSRDESRLVAAIVEHHLRPGNLAASGKVTDRAAYRFFRDIGEPARDLLFVCWADHASYLPESVVARALKRGGFRRYLKESGSAARRDVSKNPGEPSGERKTFWHLAVVSELMERSAKPERIRPARLLDGHDVMKILGLTPGPEVGRWIEALTEARALNRIRTRAEAVAFLRKQRLTGF
jgi:putative nucleotidyltransferase with HDIG domain